MGARARRRVRFFYRDEYVYDVVEAGIRHAFDVEKPRRIRDALIGAGLVAATDFIAPAAVSEDELRLVHTPEYLEEIRRPEILARLLFLDPEHPWDQRLLEPFLFATGGTVAAARMAVMEEVIAVNLGGGFHHAQADRADAFCALADVAIAIRALRQNHKLERVLIVDLDYHHGNGNAEIFAEDESVFTFSMHAGNWCWITKRNNLDVELPAHTTDATYLAALRHHLPRIVNDFRPDLVAYVAGSDPFSGDTLGDFDLTAEGMLERDCTVTREVWGRNIPMVVVTAGGYGELSWRIHFNYFRWLLTDPLTGN
jgi:acetoin utilization deacetylase AcuC-like enzyme